MLAPSGDHWGFMLLPAFTVGSSRIAPLSASRSAIRYRPIERSRHLLVKRSVTNAIVRPSADHAGCRSAYMSLVSRLALPVLSSTTNRSVRPPTLAEKAILSPEGDQVGFSTSPKLLKGMWRITRPCCSSKIASSAFPPRTLGNANRRPSALHAPAELVNSRLTKWGLSAVDVTLRKTLPVSASASNRSIAKSPFAEKNIRRLPSGLIAGLTLYGPPCFLGEISRRPSSSAEVVAFKTGFSASTIACFHSSESAPSVLCRTAPIAPPGPFREPVR